MANYPASQPGSKRHTLSVLVENRPGVLARIAGLFARRAFNINSLSVSPTERPDISRVTVTADVEAVPLEQIIKLHVLKIVELDPNSTVERELVLIKVAANESNRSDVLEIVRLFRVRVVDVNPESLTIEATGAEGKIDALLGLLEHYGVIELVRSGAVAVTRGPRALSEKVVGSEVTGRGFGDCGKTQSKLKRRMRMMHIRLFSCVHTSSPVLQAKRQHLMLAL